MRKIISSISNSNLQLNYLSEAQAELQFIRTYCGLNSGLVSEQEIIMQIQIAFRQSLAMEYLGKRGEYLLNFAEKLRSKLDDESVFNGGYSYCDVAIEQALKTLGLDDVSAKKITVLGSGGTALKSVMSLLKQGARQENIKIIHTDELGIYEVFNNGRHFTSFPTRLHYREYIRKIIEPNDIDHIFSEGTARWIDIDPQFNSNFSQIRHGKSLWKIFLIAAETSTPFKSSE